MLKAIHAQEDLVAARDKAHAVVEKLRGMKLRSAADLVERIVEQTLTYYHFPSEHWRRIRTNNPMERIIREIRRRTRVVGAFPDGQSALMLVAARLRHVASTKWRPLHNQRQENHPLLRVKFWLVDGVVLFLFVLATPIEVCQAPPLWPLLSGPHYPGSLLEVEGHGT